MSKYVKKAIEIIKSGEFDRKWDNLFENGKKKSLNVIKGLYFEAQMNEDFKHLLIKRKDNMPIMLMNMIGV